LRRLIDRDCDEVRAGGTDLRIDVAVFRQLAETERSPLAAVKHHHDPARRSQRREAPWRPRRVRELEVGSDAL
jgi:hypothetical protein